MTAKHPMIPFPVIVKAADGDIEAVNQIVHVLASAGWRESLLAGR